MPHSYMSKYYLIQVEMAIEFTYAETGDATTITQPTTGNSQNKVGTVANF